jgi:hypothetical protein
MTIPVGLSVSITVTKCLRKTTERRKDLFGLRFQRFQSMVSSSIAVGLRWAEHRGDKPWQRKAAHLMTSRKQREQQEGARRQGTPFKSMPSVTYFLQLDPTSKCFHHHLINNAIRLWIHQWINPLKSEPPWSSHLSMIGSTSWDPSLQRMGLLGTFHF